MPKDIAQCSMKDRYQHLIDVISGERFLKKQGLGNEVPFFICPYCPSEAFEMEGMRRQLVNHLGIAGVQVLEIDLYDLSITILKQRNIWDQILEQEPSFSKDELKELLQGVLDPESHLIPAIGEQLAGASFQVLFLTGVGEVFPYI